MVDTDSIIRHIMKKTGYDNTHRIKLYLSDCLRDSNEIRDMIADYVAADMSNNLEFQDETPQEKRERLERINSGGN